MKKVIAMGAVLAAALLALGLTIFRWGGEFGVDLVAQPAPWPDAPTPEGPLEAHPGFIYGRVTVADGSVYEGRLRWGGSEEAFWGDFFNGSKKENPWASHVAPEALERREPVRVFGVELAGGTRRIELVRPFMARFGDIARIDARAQDIRVTLKSGKVFELDRSAADDLADGLRVWDRVLGVVDLDERRIRSVEFLPDAALSDDPRRLFGRVRSRSGAFSGFLQWNREACLGSDLLEGESAEGPVALPFESIRSIARTTGGRALVTLREGRELELSGSRDAGAGHRGVYVDDARFGRVLVSWESFEHVDFERGDEGPAYGDFPAGVALEGSVRTREGRLLAGRVVFDLDESETSETLDAPAKGVHHTIPFGLVRSIVPREERQTTRVVLHNGEELQLERAGDLGGDNAGLLVFDEDPGTAEYVPWDAVARVDLARPAATYPRIEGPNAF